MTNPDFASYATKYQTIRMAREDGILTVTLHTNGDSLRWSLTAHSELPQAFHDIASDPENRVMILTGTGAEFSGPAATPGTTLFPTRPSIELVDRIHWEGRRLLMNLLDIEIPVISAVNGPAWRHSEIPLLGDIVLAADTAAFQDSAHFTSDLVPGDGIHLVYSMLLGVNRARYFLITGQTLDAARALNLGLVAEVMPQPQLLPRAQQLARDLARRPRLLLRYTRLMFTEPLRRRLQEMLGYSLAMEGLALMEKPPAANPDCHPMNIMQTSAVLPVPAARIWPIVSDFAGLARWNPALKSITTEGTGVGMLRHFSTGGPTVTERLVTFDPAAMTIAYTIVSGSALKVKSSCLTIRVAAQSPTSSLVTWSLDGEPDGISFEDLRDQTSQRYSARLEDLRRCLAAEGNR